MALTFAAYAAPDGRERPVVLLAVRVTRTAGVARVLLTVVVLALAVVVASALLGGSAGPVAVGPALADAGPYAVLQAAGLLFFAFAGYARVTTLGEEVRDPARTIPRAVLVALGVALALYAAVAVAVLSVLGPALAGSREPLAATVAAGSWAPLAPLVRVGAAAGALGALLALTAGVSRTVLAMAREGDLPARLAAVHPVHRVPHVAGAVQGAAVCALVLVADLRGAVGVSSFGVLLYYLVANLAALRQRAAHRRYPRALQVLGAVSCLALVATLPVTSVVAGLVLYAAGVGYRTARQR